MGPGFPPGKRGKMMIAFQRDFCACAQRGAGPDRARGVFAVDRLALVFVAAAFLAAPVFFAALVFFVTSVVAPFLAAFAGEAFAEEALAVLRPRFLTLSRCAAKPQSLLQCSPFRASTSMQSPAGRSTARER